MIGPNFGNELAAAGLAGLPLSWTAAGEIAYGESVTSDQRSAIAAVIAAHDESKPDPNIAAAQLLAAGLVLTSTGTAALNGTYACDPGSQQRIVGEQLYIQVTGGFTNAQTTRAWHDAQGVPHTFDAAQFTAFAEAVAQFVDAVISALAACLPAGTGWTAPGNAYTID